MKNRRSEDGKISREVWKAVEAKVGKIRVEKTKERRKKRRRKRKRRKNQREKK